MDTKFLTYTMNTTTQAYDSLTKFAYDVLGATHTKTYPSPKFYEDIDSSIYEENA